ncbi:MAG: PaaI family thioesterase [Sphingomonas sp.]|uniref:PaaI family thioesterase n=1 Tax=Sphingomonas sp. TaxID=28214 RepID=UPI003F7D52B0
MDAMIQARDGLAQARDLLARGVQPPIGRTLDFALVEVERGRAVFEGTPQEMHYNPMGGVHGGYAATILDSACGFAVLSMLQADQSFTTLELKVSYLRGMTDRTGPIRAEGRIVNMGRRVAFAEADIRDADGRLMATATSTLLVLAK